MKAARWWLVGMAGLAGVLLLASGCGPNPDVDRIQALQDQINKLQAENDDLRSRLAQAISERDAARSRLAALEKENADLRNRLAAKPPMEGDEWKHAGPASWIDIGSDFLFDSGKASLRGQATSKLQTVVDRINKDFSDRLIVVLGHTDTDPIRKSNWKDNLDLSVNRGAAVYRELMKLGLRPQTMIAAGQGEWNPRASNSTSQGKQLNRRVQILAINMGASLLGGGESEATPARGGERGSLSLDSLKTK